jgi:hypothetical protein
MNGLTPLPLDEWAPVAKIISRQLDDRAVEASETGVIPVLTRNCNLGLIAAIQEARSTRSTPLCNSLSRQEEWSMIRLSPSSIPTLSGAGASIISAVNGC